MEIIKLLHVLNDFELSNLNLSIDNVDPNMTWIDIIVFWKSQYELELFRNLY